MKEEILRRQDIFKSFLEREVLQHTYTEAGRVDWQTVITNVMVLYRADNEALIQEVKKELNSWLMGYDSKDGYSLLYDEVLEHLSDRIDKQLKL